MEGFRVITPADEEIAVCGVQGLEVITPLGL
jgi:hypothetical protein